MAATSSLLSLNCLSLWFLLTFAVYDDFYLDNPLPPARLAFAIGEYEDMALFLTHYITSGQLLSTPQDRDMFTFGFRKLFDKKWSQMKAAEAQLEFGDPAQLNMKILEPYIQKVQQETVKVCDDALKLLEDYLIPGSVADFNPGTGEGAEHLVVYITTAGAIHQTKLGLPNVDASLETTAANRAYMAAYDYVPELNPINPVVLRWALRYSLFLSDVMGDTPRALHLAQSSISEAAAYEDFMYDYDIKQIQSLTNELNNRINFWINQ